MHIHTYMCRGGPRHTCVENRRHCDPLLPCALYPQPRCFLHAHRVGRGFTYRTLDQVLLPSTALVKPSYEQSTRCRGPHLELCMICTMHRDDVVESIQVLAYDLVAMLVGSNILARATWQENCRSAAACCENEKSAGASSASRLFGASSISRCSNASQL